MAYEDSSELVFIANSAIILGCASAIAAGVCATRKSKFKRSVGGICFSLLGMAPAALYLWIDWEFVSWSAIDMHDIPLFLPAVTSLITLLLCARRRADVGTSRV